MTTNPAIGRAVGKGTATAKGDSRYSFTAQFLCASVIFVRRCAEIEKRYPDDPNDESRTEHRGLVTAAIMQSAAAVDAESAEVTMHGPGSHLRSDRMDMKARALLKPIAEFIDRQDVLV